MKGLVPSGKPAGLLNEADVQADAYAMFCSLGVHAVLREYPLRKGRKGRPPSIDFVIFVSGMRLAIEIAIEGSGESVQKHADRFLMDGQYDVHSQGLDDYRVVYICSCCPEQLLDNVLYCFPCRSQRLRAGVPSAFTQELI